MPERPFEGFVPPEARPKNEEEQSRETEPIRRAFEYRDADGRLLGTAEATFDAASKPMPYLSAKDGAEATGRSLLSFVLRGEKDGARTEIDMLALAVPHGVEVVASDVPLANYHYEDEARRAFVPPLETPLDVGVLLHELGHAEQHGEERFKKITPLYARSKPFASGDKPVSLGAFLELVDAVSEAVPDARPVFDHEAREQLGRLEARRSEALARKSAAERALIEQEGLRDDELRSLLGDALAGADLRSIADEAKQLGFREAHLVPPLAASPAVEALLVRLEAAGFRFEGSEAVTATIAGAAKPGEGFGATRPRSERLVRRRAVTTADQVSAIVASLEEASASDADLHYDPSSETLYASFTVDVPQAGRGRVLVEARVPDDQFAGYAKLRRGADRVVEELERKCDEEFEGVEAADKAVRHLLGGVNLKDIAALPTRMMERDATRRALRWLRQVRDKTGVNLLAPHLVKPEHLVGARQEQQEDCVGSTAGGMVADDERTVEITILEDLRRALEGYGAARMRLKPPDQDDHPGITPVAGHERPPSESAEEK